MIPAARKGYLAYRGPNGEATDKGGKFLDIVVPGFAVGALIATAVFLIFPEAFIYIGGGHGDHDVSADVGSSFYHLFCSQGH